MKTKLVRTLLIASLALSSSVALAMGKEPSKEPAETKPTPPAPVTAPIIPVSTTTARNMLELRTAPDLASFAGAWRQIMNVCELENLNATGGALVESGVHTKEVFWGVRHIRIEKAPLSVLPDQAQAQYFAKAEVVDSFLPGTFIMGEPAPMQLQEKVVTFQTVSSTLAGYRYTYVDHARKYLTKRELEEWTPQTRYAMGSWYSEAEGLRSKYQAGEVAIDWVQERSREMVYCGISASDRTLLICASTDKPEKVRWDSPTLTYKGCATAYRRVAD